MLFLPDIIADLPWPDRRLWSRICCSGSTLAVLDICLADTCVPRPVFTGLIKPVLFGFIISTVGCYYGISRVAALRSGPIDHPGRGRCFGVDSDRGFSSLPKLIFQFLVTR